LADAAAGSGWFSHVVPLAEAPAGVVGAASGVLIDGAKSVAAAERAAAIDALGAGCTTGDTKSRPTASMIKAASATSVVRQGC
jgi:hypothetical protein